MLGVAYIFWLLADVPKAQGDEKVTMKLIHVCNGFQISVKQNETVVLPQQSGSLKPFVPEVMSPAYINNNI